jgi:hypothetical protein
MNAAEESKALLGALQFLIVVNHSASSCAGEFVDAHELRRDELALRHAVTEAGECLLLHVEQGKHRETRVWIGAGVGLTLEGSEGVELGSLCWKHDDYRYKVE